MLFNFKKYFVYAPIKHNDNFMTHYEVKVKLSRYRPEQALGDPEG
jgi:hypothetical protein